VAYQLNKLKNKGLNVLKNNKGFSLIELMVVVAIIAILSTIAIPSYNSFQAKARQKEGFAMLSAYYTAAQATRAEMGAFPGNFVETGFQPTGQLHYRVTSADNAGFQVPYGTAAPGSCFSTNGACVCAPVCVPLYQSAWTEVVAGSYIVAAPVLGACAAASATNTAFQTIVSGIISSGGVADTYSMNQMKLLTMCNDGIN
jgi:prepilin-type N-terminal cleavage/methylation domain-containing protein